MIYMIMEKTHMTWHEVMWKRSWANIQMMLGDAPKMVRSTGEKEISGKGLAARFKSKKRNG